MSSDPRARKIAPGSPSSGSASGKAYSRNASSFENLKRGSSLEPASARNSSRPPAQSHQSPPSTGGRIRFVLPPMILAAFSAPASPSSSASWQSPTRAPRGMSAAHSRLKVRAPAGSTRTAATSPASSHSRAASVSPSTTSQSSESRRPTMIGRSQHDGSSAVDSCEEPSSGRYLIAVTTPLPFSPAKASSTLFPRRTATRAPSASSAASEIRFDSQKAASRSSTCPFTEPTGSSAAHFGL